jgi:hypothetical protein
MWLSVGYCPTQTRNWGIEPDLTYCHIPSNIDKGVRNITSACFAFFLLFGSLHHYHHHIYRDALYTDTVCYRRSHVLCNRTIEMFRRNKHEFVGLLFIQSFSITNLFWLMSEGYTRCLTPNFYCELQNVFRLCTGRPVLQHKGIAPCWAAFESWMWV